MAIERIPEALDIVERGRNTEEMTPRMAHATKKRCLLILLKMAAPIIIDTMMDAG